ncbi:unnamed protein product [Amoebophrya sp. A25]|nr:unnamed protein product [Amoebophrya sp. A25]|eukprot:GSA25T00013776001.1
MSPVRKTALVHVRKNKRKKMTDNIKKDSADASLERPPVVHKLNFGSYNTHLWGNSFASWLPFSRYHDDVRAATLGFRLETDLELDIVGFQELFDVRYLERFSRLEGWRHHYHTRDQISMTEFRTLVENKVAAAAGVGSFCLDSEMMEVVEVDDDDFQLVHDPLCADEDNKLQKDEQATEPCGAEDTETVDYFGKRAVDEVRADTSSNTLFGREAGSGHNLHQTPDEEDAKDALEDVEIMDESPDLRSCLPFRSRQRIPTRNKTKNAVTSSSPNTSSTTTRRHHRLDHYNKHSEIFENNRKHKNNKTSSTMSGGVFFLEDFGKVPDEHTPRNLHESRLQVHRDEDDQQEQGGYYCSPAGPASSRSRAPVHDLGNLRQHHSASKTSKDRAGYFSSSGVTTASSGGDYSSSRDSLPSSVASSDTSAYDSASDDEDIMLDYNTVHRTQTNRTSMHREVDTFANFRRQKIITSDQNVNRPKADTQIDDTSLAASTHQAKSRRDYEKHGVDDGLVQLTATTTAEKDADAATDAGKMRLISTPEPGEDIMPAVDSAGVPLVLEEVSSRHSNGKAVSSFADFRREADIFDQYEPEGMSLFGRLVRKHCGVRDGLFLLSRFSMRYCRSVALELSGGLERVVRRGVQCFFVRVSENDPGFCVFNLHAHYGGSLHDGKTRMANLAQLREIINRYRKLVVAEEHLQQRQTDAENSASFASSGREVARRASLANGDTEDAKPAFSHRLSQSSPRYDGEAFVLLGDLNIIHRSSHYDRLREMFPECDDADCGGEFSSNSLQNKMIPRFEPWHHDVAKLDYVLFTRKHFRAVSSCVRFDLRFNVPGAAAIRPEDKNERARRSRTNSIASSSARTTNGTSTTSRATICEDDDNGTRTSAEDHVYHDNTKCSSVFDRAIMGQNAYAGQEVEGTDDISDHYLVTAQLEYMPNVL